MQNESILQAIEFARQNFPKFPTKYTKDIQKLMGSLIYDKRY